ncbi:glycosyltransferase, partial [Salmonella enterica subsp. enterica serovar Virginia]|nr:glycosyltransferase [Salmonella enterica subsp. enterica serovar Virginia]
MTAVHREALASDISGAVPLYNAGADFNACMASLIAQTWSALEIIIVNDGSTDHSVEIA